MKLRLPLLVALLAGATPLAAQTMQLTPVQQQARAIFRELIEINTSWKEGSTTPAARAIANRFLAAGWAAKDVLVLGPAGDKDSNVVVRFTGKSKTLKPILLIAHLDVVEALRSDWSMDPFKLTEKDGYFYGRGTSDVKDGATTLIMALLRMKQEGIVPNRTLVLALTAGEEGGGGYDGMEWLAKEHRDLIDAAFCINVDGGDPQIVNGKRLTRPVQTSEKLYQSYTLAVTNPGGHSSMPTPENAIVRLADALGRVGRFAFPVHVTETTRGYLAKQATLEPAGSELAPAMRAIVANEHDAAAAAKLSAASPFYNAQLRTTCVPTMLSGGHAENALPQTARAVVNCRIMPGETPAQTQATLVKVIADDSVRVTPIDSATPADPSPLSPAVMDPVERVTARLWPGVVVIPVLETGATDGYYLRAAGIPTYGMAGVFIDVDDFRAHGKDERILVKSFYDGVEYVYQLVKEYAAAR
ncbi:MAG: M20/M25/M40 family metallo-hydrolase [Gemmatimonadaceae bacterium]|nr:M20/M25/M40 family metallo-hydrolase [Gemmatimonadaceae bacterium]NUR33988.1 M20/M25/M40 family metallo-hydrolase [Gemmatimonadaceae bacterium]NUS96180.1 M20/M25/M40 family metallo-hydrolase [Gemmatimonadaceae bacterium]